MITIKARITAHLTAVGPASDDSKLNHQFGLRWADSGFPWVSGLGQWPLASPGVAASPGLGLQRSAGLGLQWSAGLGLQWSAGPQGAKMALRRGDNWT